MSTFYTHQITCPACLAPIDAWLARGVHAPRRDDLRDEILARTFHRRVCVGCGLRLELAQHVVYTDFTRGHWIYVAIEADRADWAAWEARLAADVARVFADHSPLLARQGDRLRTRVAFGYEELREKLVVWESGCDDALVECAKLSVLVGEPGLAQRGARLIVESIAADGTITLLAFEAGAATPARTLVLGPDWLATTDRDRAALARRLPELFGGGYVNIRRLLTPSASTASTARLA